MRVKPTPLPEPQSREEVASRLWGFLKQRLAERRAARVGIGEVGEVPHRLPGPNYHDEVMRWQHDAPLDGAGKQLYACLVRDWPDRVRPNPRTMALLLDEVHDLQRQGILRTGFDGSGGLFITRHGAGLLDRDEVDLPPGDIRRVDQLQSEFAELREIGLISKHYREAIAAYAVGLDYSATVMIGACYEAGLHLLTQAIADARAADGLNGKHRKNLTRFADGTHVPAGELEKLIFDALQAMSVELRSEDRQWIDTCFRSVCQFVRLLRNAAGHPTGASIPRDDIAAHILLLPPYLRRVQSLVATLEGAAADAIEEAPGREVAPGMPAL